jgi:hypothetical protein
MAQIILDSNNNLIQGDFDNATLNNRTKLQTTTTNATTNVYVVPNGSSTSAGVSVANNSSLTNASKIVMATNGTTDTQIISGVNGSGSYLPLSFYTNNALAMQVATSGNVGVGVSNPGNKLSLPNNAFVSFRNTSAAETGYIGMTTGNLMSFSDKFYTDSSGNVLVGTTTQGSTARLTIKAADTGFGGIAVVQFGGSVYWTQNIDSLDGYTWAKNGVDFWFAGRSGSNNCVSASGSWVNSSDSRLKTNVKTISNALENVCNLRGVSFNRISNNSSEIGLIAQEVLEIYPDAVEKPSTDKDFYGLNYGALVAPLIEAIKEQQTIINELKTRIEALESK